MLLSEPETNRYGHPVWRWRVPNQPILMIVEEWSSTINVEVISHGCKSQFHLRPTAAAHLLRAILSGVWVSDPDNKNQLEIKYETYIG